MAAPKARHADGPEILGWVWAGRRRLGGAFGVLWHGRTMIPWTIRMAWTFCLLILNPVLRLRDFEMVALRTGWNCGCREEWAVRHGPNRLLFGKNYVESVYGGPTAPGVSERTATILQAVDEVHNDLAISPRTWDALGQYFSGDERLALLFTAAIYELQSVVLSSLGLPTRWIPAWGKRTPAALACGPRRRRQPSPGASRYLPPALADPGQEPPIDPGRWVLVWPGIASAALASQPRMARVVLSAAALQARSRLPARDTHIVLLRTIARAGPAREWGSRVALALKAGIGGDVFVRVLGDDDGSDEHDAALIRAVDELDTEYFITDRTWALLRRELSRQHMIELLALVGYHRMLAVAVNTLEADM